MHSIIQEAITKQVSYFFQARTAPNFWNGLGLQQDWLNLVSNKIKEDFKMISQILTTKRMPPFCRIVHVMCVDS